MKTLMMESVNLKTMAFSGWLVLSPAFGETPPVVPAASPAQAVPSPSTGSAPAPAPQAAVPVLPVNAPAGMAEIVRLVRSGVAESVILAYIEASAIPYELKVDDILYLNDLGTSQPVISAMLKHGSELRQAAAAKPVRAPVAAAPVAPAPVSPAPVSPAPVSPAPVSPAPVSPAPVVNDYSSSSPTVVAPPPDGVTLSFFYESLAPYGNWIQLDNSWVWRPTVAVIDSEWRPYCHGGRWVYSDCGWVWYSDYSWGWAPFHYGRWQRHARFGWIWSPDTVWGPAWVNWRMNDSHCGWAPLPPGALYVGGGRFDFHNRHVDVSFGFGLGELDFIFVPSKHFFEPSISRHMIPRVEIGAIFNKTIVRNAYGDSDDREHRWVINHGPDVRQIERVHGSPIKPVLIVDNDVRVGQPLRGESLHGDHLSVFRPKVQNRVVELPPSIMVRQERDSKRIETSRQNSYAPSRPGQDAGAPPAGRPADGSRSRGDAPPSVHSPGSGPFPGPFRGARSRP